MKTYAITLFLIGWATSLAFTQPNPEPARDSLTINNLSVHFNANGAMFWDFENGQFRPDDQPSLLQAAGLWIGGIDPGGALKVSAQLYNQDGATDFVPGVLDPASGQDSGTDLNQIWKVTRAQVESHLADLNDNGTIDAPIPAIYAWPGNGNPWFADFNNEPELPDFNIPLAPFYDQNSDGIYNPEAGDYPIVAINGCDGPEAILPTQFAWFTFHDVVLHTQTQGNATQFQFGASLFAFNCADNAALNNSVFLHLRSQNYATEALDSAYVGLFLDPTIGCPEDDYFGASPIYNLSFAYNADNEDADCPDTYGTAPPAFGMDILRGPLDPLFDADGNVIQVVEAAQSSALTFDPADLAISLDYYELLSGSYPDGFPAANDGFPYPDLPSDPDGISEYTAENQPGNRFVLSAAGPATILPGAMNEFILAFSFYPDGNNHLENVDGLISQGNAVQAAYDGCFSDMVCAQLASHTEDIPLSDQVRVFPNPVGDMITVDAGNQEIGALRLYSLTGRLLAERSDGNSPVLEWKLPDLAAGIYLLQIENSRTRISRKIMIK